jgi:peptidoglycan/xylan/chitin deacetylase (PgdA/CDA1 family)
MSFRIRIKHQIRWLSYTAGISALLAKRQAVIDIIMFHGVGSDDYPASLLEAQLQYLGKHFAVVSLDAIVKDIGEQRDVRTHTVALTFDDGLRNQYLVAYPILQRLGLTATFFVCPGLIESSQWLWNHEARERLRGLSGTQRMALCHEIHAPCSDTEGIIIWMKSLESGQRKCIEEAIRALTPDFRPAAAQCAQYDVMTWEDLAALDPAVVTVGSHTVSHPILTTLTPTALLYEIQASRRWLEERLQRPVEHFCYPSGVNDASVRSCVRQFYRSAVTSVQGRVEVTDDQYRLRRIAPTRQLPSLAWRMHQLRA